jgi:hypothetical protein
MASKKQQVLVDIPRSGVRKDVNELIQTADMASIGDNCIYFDGTIRPRPALDVEVSNYTEIGNWQELFDGPGILAQLGLAANDDLILDAIYQDPDAEYILAAFRTFPEGLFAWSIDGGRNYTVATLVWPVHAPTSLTRGIIIESMMVFGDYLYAFTLDPALSSTLVTPRIFRTPTTNLPDDGTWEEVGESETMAVAYITSKMHSSFHYNETDDVVSWMYYSYVNNNPPEYEFHVIAVFDATQAVTTFAHGSDDYYNDGIYYSPRGPGVFINNSHYLAPYRAITGTLSDLTEAGIRAFEVDITAGVITIDCDEVQELKLFSYNPSIPVLNPNPFGLTSVPTGGAPTPFGLMQTSDTRFVFLVLQQDGNNNSHFVAEFLWENDAFTESSFKKVGDNFETSSIPYPFSYGRSTEKIVWGFTIEVSGRISNVPRLLVSSDDALTFMLIDTTVEILHAPATWGLTNKAIMYFNDDADKHYLAVSVGTSDGYNYPSLFLMPTSLGDSSIGSMTTVFQGDMDDEEDALIVGTTLGIARLDSDTNSWRLITANKDQTVPTGAGETDWDTAGDIPPLSVFPSEDEYVSGVSIEGTYGANPWVFRTFEAQGYTFLIGTNGQCYPIIYHPNMAPGSGNGFARRLGEVPQGDPNYNALADYPNGNLAPKAKCIASAANRVLLANNPSGSPFEVNVGGWNDPDRGWSDTDSQLVLLGDTAGEIITMNEISALQVAIYKEDAIYHAVAQAELFDVSAPFRFELSKAGISGPCSPASVQRNFDGRHIYLARDGGLYMYDGVAPLDGGRNIRRMIQGEIDLSNLGKCWGMVDKARKLVWFFYPSSGGIVNKGIVVSTDQGYPWQVWPVKFPKGWNFATGAEINLAKDASLRDLDVFDEYGEQTLSSFSSGNTAMLVGRETGVFFTQKWDDDGSYTDSNLPIRVHLRNGWTTPGQVETWMADELYHIFSSPDPDQELQVRLRAQQIGRNIRERGPSMLSAGKVRRRTRHRVSGTQFQVDIQGSIKRMFNWGGAIMTASKKGNRG